MRREEDFRTADDGGVNSEQLARWTQRLFIWLADGCCSEKNKSLQGGSSQGVLALNTRGHVASRELNYRTRTRGAQEHRLVNLIIGEGLQELSICTLWYQMFQRWTADPQGLKYPGVHQPGSGGNRCCPATWEAVRMWLMNKILESPQWLVRLPLVCQ